jgi:hypothetical protein
MPLLLAAPALAGASASTKIATVDRPTTLSAYDTGLLFSRRDPKTERFRLWFVRRGSTPAPLPIRDRAVPFDADLGPGTHGRLLAVYSRCASEPALDPDNDDGPPDYTRSSGCDLFEFDFSTGTERKLAVSDPKASEVLPSVWGNTVAFVRDGRLLARSGLAAPRRLTGGPGRDGTPTALDLRGRRLAFGWRYYGKADGPASDMRIDDVVTGRLVKLADRFPGGGLTTIALTAPAWEGPKLYWAALCQGDNAGCPRRAGLMRRIRAGTQIAPIGSFDNWQARGGGVTYVVHDTTQWRTCNDPDDAGAASCTVRAEERPAWAPFKWR